MKITPSIFINCSLEEGEGVIRGCSRCRSMRVPTPPIKTIAKWRIAPMDVSHKSTQHISNEIQNELHYKGNRPDTTQQNKDPPKKRYLKQTICLFTGPQAIPELN